MNALLNVWQLLGWTMILFLAAGTGVFLLGAALRLALKRANPNVRYATSLMIFTLLALMPLAIAGYLASRLVPSPVPRTITTTNRTNDTNRELNAEGAKNAKVAESRIYKATEITENSERIGPINVPAINTHSSIDFESLLNHSATYLPWLWIVGTPLTFLLLATGLIGAERLRGSCQMVNDGPLRTACDELRAALGITRQVGVAVCERIATPLLVGVVKPLILLPPAALTGWTTTELEMVLVHELAHVRRWDNAVNLVQRIVESLLFFHPAVWVVSGWVRRDREDCCDAVVVAQTAKPQAYAELLVALASHAPGLATSVALAQHPLASRIRRILKLEDEPMLVTRKGLFVGVSAVVVAALLAFALPTTDAEETVNREAERVADKRAAEQTTKDTNNTKGELNAEGAEKNGKKDSVQYTVVYALGENEAEIKKWLEAVDELGDTINMWTKDGKDRAVVTGTRAGHEKLSAMFESIRAEASRQRPEVNAEAAKSAEGAEKSSLFPTLEDQRAADLAYKLLGVELEKLTPEDLERVKAKGYKGGLRVAGPIVYGAEDRVTPLLAGDLLVGLHVWPTESLDHLESILSRDDLDQLEPLKFYVIRRGGKSGGGFGPPTTGEGGLLTGRIKVDLDAWRAMRERANSATQNPGPGTTIVQQPLREGTNPSAAYPDPIDDSSTAQPVYNAPAQMDPGPVPTPQPRLPESSNQQSPLLYDGKTFEQWRSLWKTELKTEKRTECIKALAAFGRAGKGKEAAEAILDVAGEYDFFVAGRKEDPSEILKTAIREALKGNDAIPAEQWLPVFVARLEKDPQKWATLAGQVLSSVRGNSADVTTLLKGIAKDLHNPANVRSSALASLAIRPNIADDAEAVAMVREGLQSDDPQVVWKVLTNLNFSRLDLFPEQIELLFSKDEELRIVSLNLLPRSSANQDMAPIVDKLITFLADSARAEDSSMVNQVLSRLMILANQNSVIRDREFSRLKRLLIEGDSQLLSATLMTFANLAQKTPQAIIGELGDKLTAERRKELEDAAQKLTTEESGAPGSGGHGGADGGGAF
jgi:beta-lactamase regulating signal transducer with metallopeptidase domain